VLLERTDEVAQLQQAIGRARSGRGTTTVLRGEAGVGKSLLLGVAAASAQNMNIVHCRGVESERTMPYAGLQLLCTTIRADLAGLDSPQRAAMEKALGRAEGDADPFLVGLATVSLLTVLGRQRPTLYLIDDAQWLDHATAATIAFVLRRLDEHTICVLVATRAVGDDPFGEFPTLRLAGLTDADAQGLLRTASFGQLDDAVLSRIVAEARGNPRTLLDVVEDVKAAEFAGGYGLAPSPLLSPAVRLTLTARMDALDADERRLLVLAAADPTGDPALLWRAADALGIDRRVASILEDHGWLRLGPRILFVEPVERTAVYRLATADERDAIHHALADATDPVSAPDRRTWHLACATTGLDDALAAELECHSLDAQGRSGRAGAAAFLERSALLTYDPQLRSARALAAAVARFDAGSATGSAQLLVTGGLGRLDQHDRAGFDRQQARVAFFAGRNGQAAEQLLRAAQALQPTDESSACEAFLEALVATTYAGRLGPGADVFANKMPAHWTIDGLPRQLLEGLTARFAEGFAAGHRSLTPSLRGISDLDTADTSRRWLWMACCIAADLWDDARWEQLTAQALDAVRQTGSLMLLPYALTGACVTELHLGRFDRAHGLVEQINAVAASTQAPPFSCAALLLAAWCGDEQTALALIDSACRDAQERGEGIVLTTAALSTAVLYNGLGRYDAALAAARDAATRDELAVFGWSVVELIEAAARTGQRHVGAAALPELTERTQIAGTDWALGIEARSRALLTQAANAEPLYQEAIERLSRSRIRVHLARARLVYGEWLRRQGRRVDARIELKAAWESLTTIGATAFAERAYREYLATGEKVRRRLTDSAGRLTPQQSRIAALAREGLTNPEIGERLYLSPRTVEYHLHKVFEKLGISSRRDLVHTIGMPFDAAGIDPGLSGGESLRPGDDPGHRTR
jgi:DNA-binding CsgD family transcriptional regulator/tetratricopeptide (TPR) repeat protein